jgi:hypothetical protein
MPFIWTALSNCSGIRLAMNAYGRLNAAFYVADLAPQKAVDTF